MPKVAHLAKKLIFSELDKMFLENFHLGNKVIEVFSILRYQS